MRLVAGIIPLVFLLIFFGLFSQALFRDVHQSISDLKTKESHQHRLIHQQVRQKALGVAQNLTQYTNSHKKISWEQMFQDPAFREVAVQPVGMVG